MLYIWESKSRFDAKGLPVVIAAEGNCRRQAADRALYGYDARIRDAAMAGDDRLVRILKEEKEDCWRSVAHEPRLLEVYR